MNKKINIIVILISSFIIIGTIAYKLNLNIQDEVYIVSENEEKIEENNINIEKDYEINNIEYKNKENTISKMLQYM